MSLWAVSSKGPSLEFTKQMKNLRWPEYAFTSLVFLFVLFCCDTWQSCSLCGRDNKVRRYSQRTVHNFHWEVLLACCKSVQTSSCRNSNFMQTYTRDWHLARTELIVAFGRENRQQKVSLKMFWTFLFEVSNYHHWTLPFIFQDNFKKRRKNTTDTLKGKEWGDAYDLRTLTLSHEDHSNSLLSSVHSLPWFMCHVIQNHQLHEYEFEVTHSSNTSKTVTKQASYNLIQAILYLLVEAF